ncbi:MAG: hypothetical protein M3M85_03050 [bacterium]|nr:hypothetical protein [bacterium]
MDFDTWVKDAFAKNPGVTRFVVPPEIAVQSPCPCTQRPGCDLERSVPSGDYIAEKRGNGIHHAACGTLVA